MPTPPARFRFARPKLAPRWLTSGEGELLGYALDVLKDGAAERVRLGLLARLPQNDPTGATTAPPDALAAIGRDRRLIKGIGESDSVYAVRLLSWLDDRRRVGNPYMLMKQLAAYVGAGTSFRTVDARGNWYTRAADGTETALLQEENWDWDGTPIGERWSRFWVIVYPGDVWDSEPDWGDVDWGDTAHTWGSTATPEHVASVRHIVNDWKPAGTRCVNIIIAFDPASFDPTAPEPDGLWGRWSKTVSGVRVASRLSTARYWSGT